MDTIEVLMQRRSCRAYKPGSIPDSHLSTILEAGRYAPSAGNAQPWRFIVVREKHLKQQLAQVCAEQHWMADADVIITGIGVPAESRGHSDWQWYPVDVAIALQNMVLAATTLGYGTCWIGAFDQQGVKELLEVPPEMHVVALVPIGFPAVHPDAPPRKSWQALFSQDTYRSPVDISQQ